MNNPAPMKFLLLLTCCLVLSTRFYAQHRPLQPGDYYDIPSINSPVVSPDGKWIVYTLSHADSASDKIETDLHMISADGRDRVQLTSATGAETSPQFSPDGKYISFISARGGERAQVWLLDRRGGEGRKLTDEKREISSYSWSPDGTRLLLVMKDALDSSVYNNRKPFVINRYRFKKDVEGYRYDTRKTHLYTFDLQTQRTEQLTSGNHNESDAVWSPSGDHIAFVSNRSSDPDRNRNTDIWIMSAKAGAPARPLTTWKGSDDRPRFSPDGKHIAFIRSISDANSEYYEQPQLCVVPTSGGKAEVLTASLDRPVLMHRWSPDAKSIAAIIADDTRRYIASFDIQSGASEKIAEGDRSFTHLEAHQPGSWIALMAEPTVPAELYLVRKGEITKISHVHDAFIGRTSFAHVEKFESTSKDGTQVSGLVFYPPNVEKRKNLPLIVYLHGGPVSQDEFGFDLTRQMLAAQGYAVAAVNYRGSSGRGHKFSRVITGDWGNLEVQDILGACDYLVKQGIADRNRIGIAGWSYGGMLTTYSIATDSRFKAAASGAGAAFPLALYGVDEYILQYDNEIGPPWVKGNLEKYIRISYPFLHVDRIRTPTLFMGGDKDFNVPIAGSEQMYQALRSLGVPTELVVYPGQFHGLSQPSFIVDLFERYIAWFGKHLRK